MSAHIVTSTARAYGDVLIDVDGDLVRWRYRHEGCQWRCSACRTTGDVVSCTHTLAAATALAHLLLGVDAEVNPKGTHHDHR